MNRYLVETHYEYEEVNECLQRGLGFYQSIKVDQLDTIKLTTKNDPFVNKEVKGIAERIE